jgi:hypothetical protein
MILAQRIELLSRLGEYMLSNDDGWQQAKQKASQVNPWFTSEFIELSAKNIAENFLRKSILEDWAGKYQLGDNESPKTVGIVMAGNIPMVGFHDLLSTFITGHKALIKPSSKDEVLITHLAEAISLIQPSAAKYIQFAEMLKRCDAYIATGSNNTSRYFEYYFGRYHHIIRKNKTSAAILTGHETGEELEKLADDVYRYFGLGCRNITKIYVPPGYDFLPLLTAFKKKYNYLADHNKYKNNYDYNLAVLILNKKFYMTNDSILLVEDPALFSPISQLNYEYYTDEAVVTEKLKNHPDLQAIVGKDFLPFGEAQSPAIDSYADRVDTIAFLKSI